TTVPADEAQVNISRSIVNHVLVQKKAVLSQDASMDKDLPTSASIADLKLRSVMCVPLLTPDAQALGILQLDTTHRKQFHQEDLDFLTAVASQPAIAVQNARLHELALEQQQRFATEQRAMVLTTVHNLRQPLTAVRGALMRAAGTIERQDAVVTERQ